MAGEQESLMFTTEQLADLMDGMMCASRTICLLRGDSGEAQTSGFIQPVMGLRA